MNKEKLMELLVASATNKATTNFTVSDVHEAARVALLEAVGYTGKEVVDGRFIRANREEIFAIIEEVVDSVLPDQMQDILGQYAEVKSFGRGDQVIFHVRKLNNNRVKMGIVPGARGGVYRARRLDTRDLAIETDVWTVGYSVTLEELLTGSSTLADVISAITQGLTEKVYIEVVKALRAAYSVVPANNKATSSGDDIDLAGLDKVVKTISAYGRPVIIGFSSLIDQIKNMYPLTTNNPNTPSEDLSDLRRQGFVSLYKGTPVIKLPNYFADESNSQWIFKEDDIFVLPSDERPVKVAMQGDAYTSAVDQPHGGQEWHLHKMCGVGILFNNAIGIYRQTGTDDAGLY